MFKAERVYSQRNPKTGRIEWFFHAREGEIGPYDSKEAAQRMRHDFIERRKAADDDGGRSSTGKPRLSLMPLDDTETVEFDSGRQRKGVESP